jgi:hypothetical protein
LHRREGRDKQHDLIVANRMYPLPNDAQTIIKSLPILQRVWLVSGLCDAREPCHRGEVATHEHQTTMKAGESQRRSCTMSAVSQTNTSPSCLILHNAPCTTPRKVSPLYHPSSHYYNETNNTTIHLYLTLINKANMCTYVNTVYACQHEADFILLLEPCSDADEGLRCSGVIWHCSELKHWKCQGCDPPANV